LHQADDVRRHWLPRAAGNRLAASPGHTANLVIKHAAGAFWRQSQRLDQIFFKGERGSSASSINFVVFFSFFSWFSGADKLKKHRQAMAKNMFIRSGRSGPRDHYGAAGKVSPHTAELGAPLVKRGVADAMLAAQLGDR